MPFIYRRYELGRIAETIQTSNSASAERPTDLTPFREYKGVIHVHSTHTGEIHEAFDELLNAARDNELDFVLLTEHYSTAYDTTAVTLDGFYGTTLFVAGNEIDTRTGDRLLMIPGGADAADLRNSETPNVLKSIRDKNRIALIAYPERFRSWDEAFDGIEVNNLFTTSKQASRLTLPDVFWSFPAYRSLAMARHFRRPDDNLARFDQLAAQRKISLHIGLDAHSNVGFHIFGDELGHRFLGIKLDPYADVFRLSRLHVLIDGNQPLTRETLIDAIRGGRFFNGFDVLGDTKGFSFVATGSGNTSTMGDEVPFTAGMTLKVVSPLPARVVILKNGERVHDAVAAREVSLDVPTPGTYRVEVYRQDLGDIFSSVPWILSNPIYVR